MSRVTWKNEPDKHDYPAAERYLSLIGSSDEAKDLTDQLMAAPIVKYLAKDILRASGLRLLEKDNPHVAADLRKVENDEKLSPILLVRGDMTRGVSLQIADGYHRVCASYHLDENTDIPGRIVDLPPH